MTRVLVLGAGGQIARWVIETLANESDVRLSLFLRDARKLPRKRPKSARVIEGDVLDQPLLDRAMTDEDVVYANLAGDVDTQAARIVASMKKAAVKRLIFVASLGIYDEVPGKFGEWNRRMIGSALRPYRKAADVIEASDLNYTVLRPAWLTDDDEVSYETTSRKQPFKGTEVSRKSVAALIVKLIESPDQGSRSNLGVSMPDTDGDKPAFM
jgi:uncharacterized protein YbjT (DUF2867 family)